MKNFILIILFIVLFIFKFVNINFFIY
ncbi:hypothetical protein ACFW04_004564 [Cataglyphis niger]